VLFALRYETIQIPILAQALRLVPAADLLASLARQPKGGYLRRAAYFWEKANGQPLPPPTIDFPQTVGNACTRWRSTATRFLVLITPLGAAVERKHR
jgi:hypothetical protein